MVVLSPLEEASVKEVSTIGLDLAKYVFQLHGADAAGALVFRKKLRRGQVLAFFAALPSCLVAMEACGSAMGPGDCQARPHGEADRAGVREDPMRRWRSGAA